MAKEQIILVTGGCGYLGSKLLEKLGARANLTIRIFDNLSSGSHQALMDLPTGAKYEFFEGDILDSVALGRALTGVDAVIHLAAVVQTPLSFENPSWIQQVNQFGTTSLVEACLKAGVSRFIYASSTSVYGPDKYATEGDPCRPLGPYAESKHKAENFVLDSVNRGLQPTVLRFGVFTGLAKVTRFETVANKFAFYAGVQRPLTIYGKGEQTRPFLAIEDAAKSILFALDNGQNTGGEVLNVVNDNLSIKDIAEIIKEIHPSASERYVEQDIRTHYNYESDNTKIKKLGWQPSKRIAESLESIITKYSGYQKIQS